MKTLTLIGSDAYEVFSAGYRALVTDATRDADITDARIFRHLGSHSYICGTPATQGMTYTERRLFTKEEPK